MSGLSVEPGMLAPGGNGGLFDAARGCLGGSALWQLQLGEFAGVLAAMLVARGAHGCQPGIVPMIGRGT